MNLSQSAVTQRLIVGVQDRAVSEAQISTLSRALVDKNDVGALWVDASGNIVFSSTASLTLGTGTLTIGGAFVATPQTLSGAGAIDLTTKHTDLTTTGSSQALTLANGTLGQEKSITHVVDGGSAILTPTTKIGFSTITFTSVGDSATLRYTAAGWAVLGSKGVTIA